MEQTNQFNYINKVNFIRRSIRCHGISLENCWIIYIRGICSWHLSKFRKYVERKFPEFFNSIVAIKHVIKLEDNFFQVKSTAPEDKVNEFITNLASFIKSSNCSIVKGKGYSHKINFSHLRKQFFTSTVNYNSKYSLTSYNSLFSLC